MKVKIRENFYKILFSDGTTGPSVYNNLIVKNIVKYVTLPLDTFFRSTILKNSNFRLFYDGTTNGAYTDRSLDALGARFIPFVQLTNAGWTPQTPFYTVTTKGITGMVKKFVERGLTYSSKAYAYINWTEDNREFILFDGYTGPPNYAGNQYRTVADHQLLQQTMATYLVGGTCSDGTTCFGLKHYFPGVSFGFYNIPPWWRSDTMWDGNATEVDNSITFAANVVAGCTALMDAVDILMPSLYSSTQSPMMMKIRAEQAMKLCNRINDKLILAGKPPKEIIPWATVMYNTIATNNPYSTFDYTVGSNSYYAVNFLNDWLINENKIYFKYTPPYTVMTSDDIIYETYHSVITNGAHGVAIWSPIYEWLNWATTSTDTDTVISQPYVYNNTLNWNAGYKRGVTGATAIWSEKDLLRQAFSAHLNYTKGACMGITGNRWWWKEISGSTAYTPTEWYPLQGNEGITSQNTNLTIPTTQTTINTIKNMLHTALENSIKAFTSTWYSNK